MALVSRRKACEGRDGRWVESGEFVVDTDGNGATAGAETVSRFLITGWAIALARYNTTISHAVAAAVAW